MEVTELGTKEKTPYGGGIEHRIYSSEKNPDVLFKVGEKDVIFEWYDLFVNNPEFFAKVYGIGKIPNSNNFYVKIEKLDTQKFESKWDSMEESLEDTGILDVDRGESFVDIYLNYGSDSEKIKEILLSLKSHDVSSFKFFTELIQLIKQAEKVQNDFLKKDTLIDVHKYNFGYTKDGKIKILDV